MTKTIDLYDWRGWAVGLDICAEPDRNGQCSVACLSLKKSAEIISTACDEIERLRDVLKRIAASHGASDHACFRRSLADIALSDESAHEPEQKP